MEEREKSEDVEEKEDISEEKEETETSETVTEEVSGEELEEVEEERVEEKIPIKGKRRGIGKVPSYIIEAEEISEEEKIYERVLTIRFFPRILSAPKWKRAKKAAKVLRELVDKYVKYAPHPETGNKVRLIKRKIWIHPKINEQIWSRGAKNPPRRIRVRVVIKAIEGEREKEKGLPVELRVMPIQ